MRNDGAGEEFSGPVAHRSYDGADQPAAGTSAVQCAHRVAAMGIFDRQ